jgi:PAS domain S-box-containing protein
MRLLVVDDHELVRRGICSVLAAAPAFTVCGEALDGRDAIDKAKILRPDVVIMDISMPKMNGLEATREIKQFLPETEIVIVSQHEAAGMISQAFNAGARAYVAKSSIPTDLLEAITKVGRHENVVESPRPAGADHSLDAQEILQRSVAFEKALRQSEELFRSAMNNMAEGLYTVDTQGLVTYINPSAEAMFGWTSAELLGKKMHEVTHYKHPDGTPFPAADCRGLEVLEKGTEIRGHEDVFIRKDGSFFPVVFSASPLKINDATIGIVVCFREDNKPRGEEASRLTADILNTASERRLIDLFPMAAYAVRAPDGVIAWFNARATQLWGRVPKLGDTDERFCGAYKLFHPDGTYMAHCETPVALVLRTGVSVHNQDVVIERPDGSRVTVSVYIDPIRDKDGKIVGATNFFHDITQQKQSERALSLLAAIVDSSDDAIVSKSLEGVITSWNQGAERIFGYSPKEAIGQHITLIVPADRRDEEATILDRLKRGERVDHFETVRVSKGGKALDVSLTISPVKDAIGRVVGASKVARDITEKKRVERALHESEERFRVLAAGLETQVHVRTLELEQRNMEVLQQSHQLRELSNRLQQTQDDERRRIARELHDSAGQILTVLGLNLATIAQSVAKDAEAGKAVEDSQELVWGLSKEIRTMSYLLHPPLLDESGLSGAIQWYVEGLSERSGMKVKVEISDNFGRLPGEMEMAVFRIVQECLTNIHRHAGSESATIRLLREAKRVTLEIRDEGKGMSAEKLAAIQAQRSGVGITGMRERVRHLKGTMDFQSNGNGTKILVRFPVSVNASPRREVLEHARAAE